jgi:hypothetical protein
MPSKRTSRSIAVIAGFGLAALAFYVYQVVRSEVAEVRARFEEMRLGLAANDTNAIRSLYAPELRARAADSIVANFVEPLGPNSYVFIKGSSAWVHPHHRFLFGFVPGGGNAVLMTNVNGIWYFTGKVSID